MKFSKIGALTTFALFFASLPTAIVIMASFNSGAAPKFPLEGISVHGYTDLLSDSVIRASMVRALLVGLISVAISLPTGLLASLALYRYRIKGKGPIGAYLILGFSVPLVVSGMAFLVLYTRSGQMGSLTLLAVAVVTVNFPFMLLSIGSSINLLNPQLEEVSRTLGAERIQTFVLVTLPGLLPGVLMGSLLMFVFGTTEFLVSLIISTTANQTLPIVLFGGLRSGLKTRHAAAGGIYIAMTVLIVFMVTRFRALDQFLFRKD